MQTTALIGFVKNECSNFDKHYRTCLSGYPCKVLNGERCGYFEKCVLGRADYKYKIPGYDYAKLFAQYAQQTRAKAQRVKVRRCDCGEPLMPRRRYCDKCRTKRARETNRNKQRELRLEKLAV